MTCKQYMFPDEPISRKTFLTAEEEEELIRRLYICPRLHVYPTKLYEDVPPLKFWNSPASVIESYLQRKVFQKRLQMAYEFNQSKEPHEEILLYDSTEEGPNRLTKAVKQLRDDINYFTHLASQSLPIETQESGDRNKDLWDEIRPQENFSSSPDDLSLNDGKKELNQKSKLKLQDDIKKRFSEYKHFYKLKNLNSDEKPPLAFTIDKPHQESDASIQLANKVYRSKSSVEIYHKNRKVSVTQSKDQSYALTEEFSERISNKYVKQRAYTGKLPQLQSPSEDYFPNNTALQKVLKNVPPVNDDLDSLLPQVPLGNPPTNIIPRGTLLASKDSIELTHKKFSSKARKSSSNVTEHPLPPIIMASFHKDSLTIISNRFSKIQPGSLAGSHTPGSASQEEGNTFPPFKRDRSTLKDHQDSLVLALQRINSSKEKVNEEFKCDLCNNQESNSIQFVCDYHAGFNQVSNLQPSQTIISTTKSCLSHRDSVELAKQKASLKDNRKSVACQANENNNEEDQPQFKNITKKETTMNKQNEEIITGGTVIKSNSKLNKYLMGAVQINRVSTSNNFSLNKKKL